MECKYQVTQNINAHVKYDHLTIVGGVKFCLLHVFIVGSINIFVLLLPAGGTVALANVLRSQRDD